MSIPPSHNAREKQNKTRIHSALLRDPLAEQTAYTQTLTKHQEEKIVSPSYPLRAPMGLCGQLLPLVHNDGIGLRPLPLSADHGRLRSTFPLRPSPPPSTTPSR